MSHSKKAIDYHYFTSDAEAVMRSLGKEALFELLKKMVLIRQFEMRAEAAYQEGNVGGFFHAYSGQEAIQTAAVAAFGKENWWTATYRCHALALLLGESPDSLMAELFGKETGNAKGRGGSMHFYSQRMLGGFGIVGGHVPVATGAAFSIKYQEQQALSLCFLGDGAVAQGALHESLNLASLWSLPCVYVVENNHWGMGTAVERAICLQPIAEKLALSYGISSYTLDGMDLLQCYGAFSRIAKEVKETSRPVLVEAVTERFKGHSISDPGLYRSKEELQECISRDPITHFSDQLKKAGLLTDSEFEAIESAQREIVKRSLKYAQESPWPEITSLEEGVFAP